MSSRRWTVACSTREFRSYLHATRCHNLSALSSDLNGPRRPPVQRIRPAARPRYPALSRNRRSRLSKALHHRHSTFRLPHHMYPHSHGHSKPHLQRLQAYRLWYSLILSYQELMASVTRTLLSRLSLKSSTTPLPHLHTRLIVSQYHLQPRHTPQPSLISPTASTWSSFPCITGMRRHTTRACLLTIQPYLAITRSGSIHLSPSGSRTT